MGGGVEWRGLGAEQRVRVSKGEGAKVTRRQRVLT